MGGTAIGSRRAARRVLALVGIGAAVLAGGACSSKEAPRPAVITTPTVAAGVPISCPAEAEVVVTTAPIALGTPVADALASGALVRRWIPQKYRPGSAADVAALSGTITVPMPTNTLVVSGTFAPDGSAPAVLAPAGACAPADDVPATVYVLREDVPAGAVLTDLVASAAVVSAEIPASFLPEGAILDPAPLAAVTALPANTVVTTTAFA